MNQGLPGFMGGGRDDYKDTARGSFYSDASILYPNYGGNFMNTSIHVL